MVVTFEALYAEHEAGMHRYAASLAGPDAAADITAEAFARVMPVMAGGGEIRDPRAYLAATVRHVAADWLKARARTWPGELPELPGPGGPEAAALDGIDRQVAAWAFAALDYRWRLVLWRTEVEGVPARELAGELGMTSNAVAQLAARAREGLRQSYLAEHMSPRAPIACRRAAMELAAVVRGHAAARKSGRVSRHLRRCDNCAALAEEMALLNTRLGSILAPIGLGTAASLAARHTVTRTVPWKAWTPIAHPLMFGASAVAATASLVYVTAVQPASPQAAAGPLRPEAAVSGHAAARASTPAAPAAVASTSAAAPPTAADVTAPAAPGTPDPAAGASSSSPGPGDSGLAPAVTGAGDGASAAASGLGGAVTGVTGASGQVLGGPAGGIVSGLGSTAGGAVTGAGGVVSALTGTVAPVGGLLGP